jgi:hypothetical protein
MIRFSFSLRKSIPKRVSKNKNLLEALENMVPLKGFEPPTHALRMRCSTPELQRPAKLFYPIGPKLLMGFPSFCKTSGLFAKTFS